MPIPAKLTWLLQPLDTHLFQQYKCYLQKAYQVRRQETMAAGALNVQNMLGCIYDSTEHVLGEVGGWKAAFLEDGFGAQQARLSGFRKEQLELDGALDMGDERPSEEQVQLCFPQRQRVPPMSQLFCCPVFQLPLEAPTAAPTLPAPSGVPRGVRLFGGASPSASSSGLAVGGGGVVGPLVDSHSVGARLGPQTRSRSRLLALAKASSPGA